MRFWSRRSKTPRRFKILILAEDGEVLYWRKRGELHVVDEDVARSFVAGFRPDVFQVTTSGGLQPPEPGVTRPILRVEMIPVD